MRKRSCDGACYCAEIDVLKEKLGAGYETIAHLAESLNCTIDQAERFLWGTERKHNLSLVWLGQEQVGPEPFFIARPQGNHFDVTLYSRLPQEQWRRP